MKNEDAVTTTVEEQTKKIPSISFLGVALGCMAVSAGLMLTGRKQWANFIGQWAPSILIMGTYNKLSKTFSAPANEHERVKHGDNASFNKSSGELRSQLQMS